VTKKNKEKYCEWQISVMCYVDHQRAFDRVWRVGLCRVMKWLEYDYKIVRLLKVLHMGTKYAIRVDGDLTKCFETVVGVATGLHFVTHSVQHFIGVVVALA